MSLSIYYTGATQHQGKQEIPSSSLGGFISSSLIPNDALNNLFSEISTLALEKKIRQTRVIAIKNISNSTLTGLKVYLVHDEVTYTSYKVGFQIPDIDMCDDICSEKLSKGDSIPQRVILVEAEGNPNALALPDLGTQEYLFIFISRSITQDVPSYTSDELIDQQEEPLEQTETTQLSFAWD